MSATGPIVSDPRRFSIRMPRPVSIGLAAVVVIVVGTGLRVGVPIYRQQVAIQEIKRLGGTVLRDAKGPDWLQVRAPELCVMLGDVTTVSLTDTSATDDTLAHLRGFDHVRQLFIDGTAVSDAGLAHLEGLTRMRELSLCRTRITDAGLTHLKSLTHLRILPLLQTRVTDAGVAELKRALPGLTVFR
jgi:hypothetical protein